MAFKYDIPAFSTLNEITDWYNKNSGSMTQAYKDYYTQKYLNPLQSLIGWNASTNQWDQSKWPTYNPVQWGDPNDPTSYAGRYGAQQAGMSELLARIGAGPQTSDLEAAQGDVAALYGYSPSAWSALIQGMPERLNASTVMQTAASTAMGLETSPFGQEQQAAMKMAQRDAQVAVGKQLEAIFGERGGLAGFQAAYEMTSQLQSTFLQQQAQYHLSILDRSIAAVNAENAYYQDLVNRGAVQAQDYLKFRWDALQTGYQDYLSAMNQTMQEWTTRAEVSRAQYTTQAKVIQDQVDAITGAMASEMGLDQAALDYLQGQYAASVQPALDQRALDEQARANQQAAGRNIGGGIMTVGAGMMAIPGMQIPGLIVMGVGGLLMIAANACPAGGGGGTATPRPESTGGPQNR